MKTPQRGFAGIQFQAGNQHAHFSIILLILLAALLVLLEAIPGTSRLLVKVLAGSNLLIEDHGSKTGYQHKLSL